MAIFSFGSRTDFSTHVVSQELHAVTNAENRNSEVEKSWIWMWCFWRINAGWSSGKNDSSDGGIVQEISFGGVGQNFRVNVELSNPTSNNLSVLTTKIKDDDLFHLGKLKNLQHFFFTSSLMMKLLVFVDQQVYG